MLKLGRRLSLPILSVNPAIAECFDSEPSLYSLLAASWASFRVTSESEKRLLWAYEYDSFNILLLPMPILAEAEAEAIKECDVSSVARMSCSVISKL